MVGIKEAQELLKTAGVALRSVHAENELLRQKLASYEREHQIHAIAQEMERKSIQPDLTYEEKVAHLRSVPNLDVTSEAVKLSARQNGYFGNVSDEGGSAALDSAQAFAHYVNTGEELA